MNPYKTSLLITAVDYPFSARSPDRRELARVLLLGDKLIQDSLYLV
jgi:hypothetical protein